MKKQLLVAQIIVSAAVSAFAGGVGSVGTCKQVDQVLLSAPLEVYLPDGMTKQTVGEASLVSRKSDCGGSNYESIYVHFKLDDEIKPYGIKIKGTITGFEQHSSVGFRLKELVNSTETFNDGAYAETKINDFGGLQTLDVTVKTQSILFWDKTTAQGDVLITATPSQADGSPLACSLHNAYASLIKIPNSSNTLTKNLQLTAIFRGPLQLCP
jgi:hypothetical protein